MTSAAAGAGGTPPDAGGVAALRAGAERLRAAHLRAAHLRAAHDGGTPLLLANAWDAASAAAFAAAGLDVIATSSGAISRSLGYSDGEGTPVDEMFAALRRIVAAARRDGRDVLVTADVEHGYGLDEAELVARLARVGVVGCNLEDSDPRTRRMIPTDAQAARLAALRRAADEAGTGLVINARVDLHVRADGDERTRLGRSIARAEAYLAAGADCVFPIMLAADDDIAAYVRGVPGPVNVMATHATPPLKRLAELGVARVSFGSGFHRIAMEAVAAAAARLRAGDDPRPA